MKQYALKCHCGRSDIHGYTPPAVNLQTCCTARAIRAGCRDFGCRFELVEQEAEMTDVDRLRLGLREDVVKAVAE
jgi:hypothetical protein